MCSLYVLLRLSFEIFYLEFFDSVFMLLLCDTGIMVFLILPGDSNQIIH